MPKGVGRPYNKNEKEVARGPKSPWGLKGDARRATDFKTLNRTKKVSNDPGIKKMTKDSDNRMAHKAKELREAKAKKKK